MIGSALAKVFGTSNERAVKRLLPRVQVIGDLEAQTQALSDEQLRAKTAEFRGRIAAALEGITDDKEREEAEKQVLDDILPEAFAVVRDWVVGIEGGPLVSLAVATNLLCKSDKFIHFQAVRRP